MTLSDHIPGANLAAERTERALRLPVGVISPLWAVFSAAAGVGVAYWWMTRFARAVNVEALAALTPGSAPQLVAPPEATVTAPAIAVSEPVAETVVEATTSVAEAAEAPSAPPAPTLDDLTLLVGIGPKLAAGLAERGVTSFAQIAAWTADDIAEVDAALGLKGRAARDEWVAQARRLSES